MIKQIEDYFKFHSGYNDDDIKRILTTSDGLRLPYCQITEDPLNNLSPHYSDNNFKKPQTLWTKNINKLKKENDVVCYDKASYVYSDRLYQYDYDKTTSSFEKAKEEFKVNTPKYFESFLRHYYDDNKLELVHILSGFNLSNGYPYLVYGFISSESGE